jgi:hypothetical protein
MLARITTHGIINMPNFSSHLQSYHHSSINPKYSHKQSVLETPIIWVIATIYIYIYIYIYIKVTRVFSILAGQD